MLRQYKQGKHCFLGSFMIMSRMVLKTTPRPDKSESMQGRECLGLHPVSARRGGEGGSSSQRMAIAWTVAEQPGITRLGEATGVLDTAPKRVVQVPRWLRRPATVMPLPLLTGCRCPDPIFAFHAEVVAKSDTHKEAVAQCGMYVKMCQAGTPKHPNE